MVLLLEKRYFAKDFLGKANLTIAVSSPNLAPEKPLPVMVFIYGGGYKAGTQLKMGYERLGDVNDVVLVAINYRVGPLGKSHLTHQGKNCKNNLVMMFFQKIV